MNISLLLEVKEHFLQHPDELKMDAWVCGTQCCIAGLVCKLKKPVETDVKIETMTIGDNHWEWFSYTARKLLRLNQQQAAHLFVLYSWPFECYENYNASTTCQQRAKVLAKRLDLFIASGGTQ